MEIRGGIAIIIFTPLVVTPNAPRRMADMTWSMLFGSFLDGADQTFGVPMLTRRRSRLFLLTLTTTHQDELLSR